MLARPLGRSSGDRTLVAHRAATGLDLGAVDPEACVLVYPARAICTANSVNRAARAACPSGDEGRFQLAPHVRTMIQATSPAWSDRDLHRRGGGPIPLRLLRGQTVGGDWRVATGEQVARMRAWIQRREPKPVEQPTETAEDRVIFDHMVPTVEPIETDRQGKKPPRNASEGRQIRQKVAETEGFEPSVPLRGLHLSRVVH